MTSRTQSGRLLLIWGLVLALWMAGSLWAMGQWPPEAVHLPLLDDRSLLGSFLSFAALLVGGNLFFWLSVRRPARQAEAQEENSPEEEGRAMTLLRLNLLGAGLFMFWQAGVLQLASVTMAGDSGIPLLPSFFYGNRLAQPLALVLAGGCLLVALALLLRPRPGFVTFVLLLVPMLVLLLVFTRTLSSEFSKMFNPDIAIFALRWGAGSFAVGSLLLVFMLIWLLASWQQHRSKPAGAAAVIHFKPDLRQLVWAAGPLVIWLLGMFFSKAFMSRPLDPVFMLGLLAVPVWQNGRYWLNHPCSRNAFALVRFNALMLGLFFLALWCVSLVHFFVDPGRIGPWMQLVRLPFVTAFALMLLWVASLERQTVTFWQALLLSAACAYIAGAYVMGHGLYFRYFAWGPDGSFFTALVSAVLCLALAAAIWAARGEQARA